MSASFSKENSRAGSFGRGREYGGRIVSDKVIESLYREVEREPYARKLGLKLVEAGPGLAVVEMDPGEDTGNIFGMLHGGAIFSLMDEAFEVSCNAHGTVAVALSMSLVYHRAPNMNGRLRAESREIHKGRKTATYEIKVTDQSGALVASCQALAYRKGTPLPFLE